MKKNKKSFFTLTEILVTIGIIAFLFGISIGGMSIALRLASESKCKAMIKKFEMAAESYRMKVGYYPQAWTARTATVPPAFHMDSVIATDNFNNYLPVQDSELKKDTATDPDRGWLKDPWDRPYVYDNPGIKNPTKFDFYSKGADGVDRTTDDIGNFQ